MRYCIPVAIIQNLANIPAFKNTINELKLAWTFPYASLFAVCFAIISLTSVNWNHFAKLYFVRQTKVHRRDPLFGGIGMYTSNKADSPKTWHEEFSLEDEQSWVEDCRVWLCTNRRKSNSVIKKWFQVKWVVCIKNRQQWPHEIRLLTHPLF